MHPSLRTARANPSGTTLASSRNECLRSRLILRCAPLYSERVRSRTGCGLPDPLRFSARRSSPRGSGLISVWATWPIYDLYSPRSTWPGEQAVNSWQNVSSRPGALDKYLPGLPRKFVSAPSAGDADKAGGPTLTLVPRRLCAIYGGRGKSPPSPTQPSLTPCDT